MKSIRIAGNAVLGTLAGALLLGTPLAFAETDLGELIVTDASLLVLEAGNSPYVSQGANVGNPPHSTALAPNSGELVVSDGVEWSNSGRFWVGSHFGIQSSTGSVLFESGSTFNNTSSAVSFPELPQDVRIGQGGTGTVTLQADAVWNNIGVANNQTFLVASGGLLQIEGQLLSDANSSIDGGVVNVQGPDALWEVGGFGLDIEGFGQTGLLAIAGGGRVTELPFAQIGFSNNSSGLLTIGETGPPVFNEDEDDFDPVPRSLLAAGMMEIGVFGTAEGTVEVNNGGRIEINSLLRMGRGGGTGLLAINEGGEVLVGGFFGSSFFGQQAELWSGGTIDLSGGGKMIIGTNTGPLDEPGLPNDFESMDAGTLLVGQSGVLKGTGTVIGDVLISTGGTLSPGHSAGEFVIDGDLTLAGGTLLLEIGGSDAGQYDQVSVSGLLTLGGTLLLSFIDGFAPEQGTSFQLDLFQATALGGAFSSVNVEGLGGLELGFDASLLASGQPVTFTVVPIPAAAWLFLSAIGLVSCMRRLKR